MGLNRPTLAEYIEGIKKQNKIVLARAITLAESLLPNDKQLAEQLIENILPDTGKSIRIGITGPPGVGKSTFIESFGKYLTNQNKRVAVLAIDPSSSINKGSILGDKTRMDELGKDPSAFIRPTSAGIALGGVSHNTREAILLCEAAGYEIIMVETVGVGQTEAAVRNMVDFFMLLLLAGAGDELQGIKKGIMEMADGIVITKADGKNIERVAQAQADIKYALHLFELNESGWVPPVLISSSIEKTGIVEVWNMVVAYERHTRENGFFEMNRNRQNICWLEESFSQAYKEKCFTEDFLRLQKELETSVWEKQITPLQAVRKLLNQIELRSCN